MGDFRADGARPRRTNDLNASRAGRNGQHTQKEARESNGLPPLRSDAGPWRNSKQAARNTPSSAGLSSQQDETPEWMDDQTENLPGGRSGPSWFGAPGGATDGVDEIQAFKAQMKAMEAKQMRRDNDLPSEPRRSLLVINT